MIEKVFAEGLCNPVLPAVLGGCGGNSSGGVAIGELISNLVGLMFIIAFIMAFIYLLTGGLQWITSGGDKAKLETARERIVQALVGLVVVASAWAIASLAASFFCLDINRLPIPVIGTPSSSSCRGSGSGTGSASGVNSPPLTTGGDCSYAKNGGYACFSSTECVQCVNGSTVYNVSRTNCSGMACGQ